MLSSTNVSILLICMAFFGFRSYKKGLWKALLGLAGFVGAYVISFLAAPHFGHLLSGKGPEGIVQFIGAMLVLFVVSSAAISYIPVLIFPGLKNASFEEKLMGAAFGALTGAVFAVLLIWFVGVAASMLDKEGGVPKSPDALSTFSSKVVSKAVSSGISAIEKDPYKASATAAFLSSPQKFTRGFQSLSKSKKLQTFWQDGRAQFYMKQGNIEQLMREPAFTTLMSDPAMQLIVHEAKPKDTSPEQAQEYFAKQSSFVFRRMHSLRSDPRVVGILEDPEVKALVQQQNPINMLRHEKIQSLVAIVMEQPIEENLAEAQETMEIYQEQAAEQASEHLEKVSEPVQQAIYKWVDENGKTQYTDLVSTPEHLRDTAVKVLQ